MSHDKQDRDFVQIYTCKRVASYKLVPLSSRKSSSENQRGLPNRVGSMSRYLPHIQCKKNQRRKEIEYVEKKKKKLTYGFQEERGRRRSKVRNKMMRKRSSTWPSSNMERHSGPRRGSWRTLIGVIANSSGTTTNTSSSSSELTHSES